VDGVPVLNPTEGSLLGFLLDGPKTGWDLLQEVSSALQRFWNVTPSHVYRELKVLADRGLVVAGEPGPRDARPFAVTAAGRDAFAHWLDQEPAHETMRFPLLVTLWFGRHLDPDRLAAFLRRHRHHHGRRLAAYRAIAEAAPADPYVDAVVGFGVAYEAAVVRWLDQVAKERRAAGDAVQ